MTELPRLTSDLDDGRPPRSPRPEPVGDDDRARGRRNRTTRRAPARRDARRGGSAHDGCRIRGLATAALLATALPLAGCASSTPPAASRPSSSAAPSAPASASASAFPRSAAARAETAFRGLEERYGARLGVAVLDTRTGAELEHRGDERFAFDSTGKTMTSAAVLRSSTSAQLDEVMRYSSADLLSYAPITSQHVATGMTVRELLDAALRYSDNTAENLLMSRVGGPAGVQRFVRSLGDRVTSVDRTEPDLNSATPGDPRDTSTPDAFARDLEAVLRGRALDAGDRALLVSLMRANTTGGADIRAGVPSGWAVADKTGSGGWGTLNDVALVTPPHGHPLVVVLFSARGSAEATSDHALLADATRVVVQAVGSR